MNSRSQPWTRNDLEAEFVIGTCDHGRIEGGRRAGCYPRRSAWWTTPSAPRKFDPLHGDLGRKMTFFFFLNKKEFRQFERRVELFLTTDQLTSERRAGKLLERLGREEQLMPVRSRTLEATWQPSFVSKTPASRSKKPRNFI